MEVKDLVPAISTVVTSAAGALIAVYLKDWIEQRRDLRHDRREGRSMRRRTDRSTYNRRPTRLVRCHLASYIRGGRWHSSDADLRRLVSDLGNGNGVRFLDQRVDERWRMLVRKSVILVRKRLEGTISELDIKVYNVMHQEWEYAAKEAFGPIRDQSERLRPRRREGHPQQVERAA